MIASKLFVHTVAAVIMLAACSVVYAQREKHQIEINTDTPEGKILAAIGQESDPAKKLALADEFMTKYPGHRSVAWVLSRQQAEGAKTGDHAKVIAAGEKLLAADPMDIEAAYANLKASEALKDSEGVLSWSGVTSGIARKIVEGKIGEASEIDWARQVDIYTEYSLYATALQEADAEKAMKLGDALEQRNPKSQYIAMSLPRYSSAGRQANAMARAVAYGERAYARGQFAEEMLLAMADHALQQKQPDKAVEYSKKAVETMNRPKPEGVSDADWEKKKQVTTGLALWMAGTTLSGQNKFAEADKLLREALPLVKDNEQLRGPALFHLGLANYQLAKASKNKAQIADAVAFSKQAAAAKGPLAAQAAKNLTVMQKEFGVR